MMIACKTFETDGEFDIARTYYVLDLKFLELGVESEFLNDASIFARC